MSANQYADPGANVTQAARLLVPGAITLVVAVCLYVTRMWTRSRPVNNLGWDDYTVSVAMVSRASSVDVAVILPSL